MNASQLDSLQRHRGLSTSPKMTEAARPVGRHRHLAGRQASWLTGLVTELQPALISAVLWGSPD